MLIGVLTGVVGPASSLPSALAIFEPENASKRDAFVLENEIIVKYACSKFNSVNYSVFCFWARKSTDRLTKFPNTDSNLVIVCKLRDLSLIVMQDIVDDIKLSPYFQGLPKKKPGEIFFCKTKHIFTLS